jgi:tetratricopeptide (TPR) repeat protein
MRGAADLRNHVAVVLVAFAVGLICLPSPVRAADDATEQARQHYQKGKQHFDLGKWDEAIAEFEEAYRLHSDPTLLFNLAQAHRRKGDLQRALDLYKNYIIGNPESPKREEIEKRIQTLEKEIKTTARRQPTSPSPVGKPNEPPPPVPAVPVLPPISGPSSGPTPEVAPPPATPLDASSAPPQTTPELEPSPPPPAVPMVMEPVAPAPITAPVVVPQVTVAEPARPSPALETPSAGGGLRTAGILCGVAGLASVATAVYFYSRAITLSDRVSKSDAPDSDFQAGKNAETMQWVFYSVGAGALVTGSILYYLGWTSSAGDRTTTSVAPMFGPGLAGLSARGAF